MEPNNQEGLVHNFSQNLPSSFKLTNTVLAVFIGAAFLGIIGGFLLSKNYSSSIGGGLATASNSSNIAKGTILGSEDTKTFKDTAEGILKEGGIDGEGAFHLVRTGGESQNVYLTSSLVDLSKLLDRKVKIWGETQKAKVAGWLMDVGRVEVLE